MTWFPGLRRRGAVRQLRVAADAGQVMRRLTDSDRREREWRLQVDQREDVREPRADRLPNGGLRCRYEWVQGRLELAHRAGEFFGFSVYPRSVERALERARGPQGR